MTYHDYIDRYGTENISKDSSRRHNNSTPKFGSPIQTTTFGGTTIHSKESKRGIEKRKYQRRKNVEDT